MRNVRWTTVLILLAICAAGHAQVKGSSKLEPQLEGRKDILYCTDFESADWMLPWGHVGHKNNMRIVAPETTGHGKAFDGKALEVRVEKDGHYGIAPMFYFEKHIGRRPDEIWARYYLYLAEDWKGYGGKAPGWSGTEAAGWGGKPSNGTNGWSARGGLATNKDGTFSLTYYTYHARMKGQYGDSYRWQGEAAKIKPGQWYCIEEYCKINTPKKNNGILRAWVNGKQVFEKTDVCMRDTDALHLKAFWMNFYHGGKRVSNQERHAYIDNFVLATGKRIGVKP